MSDLLAHRRTVELSTDRRFAGRVRRLALTSVVALGIIWGLAAATLEAPSFIGAGLALGWLLMPSILVASLADPRWRYALVFPASLVGSSLFAISVAWPPEAPLAAVGWVLMTCGVLLGGLLGLWFWYRLVPVPKTLDDPFSPGRLGLIRAHVVLIVIGLLLAASPLLTP